MGEKPNGILARAQDLHKVYERGSERIDVLQGVDMEVPDGDFTALMGPSGSGKTTLLNLIGGLDRPTRGALVVAGRQLASLSLHRPSPPPLPAVRTRPSTLILTPRCAAPRRASPLRPAAFPLRLPTSAATRKPPLRREDLRYTATTCRRPTDAMMPMAIPVTAPRISPHGGFISP